MFALQKIGGYQIKKKILLAILNGTTFDAKRKWGRYTWNLHAEAHRTA